MDDAHVHALFFNIHPTMAETGSGLAQGEGGEVLGVFVV